MQKLLLLLLSSTVALAQIDCVEPPFWYVDRHVSELQIMFYGNNIAQNEVNASHDVAIKFLGATAIWPTPLCQGKDESGLYPTYGHLDVHKIDSGKKRNLRTKN